MLPLAPGMLLLESSQHVMSTPGHIGGPYVGAMGNSFLWRSQTTDDINHLWREEQGGFLHESSLSLHMSATS